MSLKPHHGDHLVTVATREVDWVLGNTDNILEQTINVINMESDRALLEQNNTAPGTSHEFNTDPQKFPVMNEENTNTPIMDRTIPNQSQTPVIENLFTEPSTQSDRSIDTIRLEAALKLLLIKFSGINQLDLDHFLE